jgi:hypothetical protein
MRIRVGDPLDITLTQSVRFTNAILSISKLIGIDGEGDT